MGNPPHSAPDKRNGGCWGELTNSLESQRKGATAEVLTLDCEGGAYLLGKCCNIHLNQSVKVNHDIYS